MAFTYLILSENFGIKWWWRKMTIRLGLLSHLDMLHPRSWVRAFKDRIRGREPGRKTKSLLRKIHGAGYAPKYAVQVISTRSSGCTSETTWTSVLAGRCSPQ